MWLFLCVLLCLYSRSFSALLFTVLMYVNDEMDFESCLCILCVCVSLNASIFIDAGVFYTSMD